MSAESKPELETIADEALRKPAEVIDLSHIRRIKDSYINPMRNLDD